MAIPLAKFLRDFGSATEDREADTPAALAGGAETPVSLVDDTSARRLDDAYARGEQAGRAAAHADYEQKTAELRAHAEEHLDAERRRWAAEQAEQLAVQFASAVEGLEARIAASVAHVLTPFLTAGLRTAILEGLAESVRALISDGGQAALHISGPRDLLENLQERLSACAATIEYVPNDAVEVRIVADQTLIESDIQAWLDRFGEADR